MNFITLQETVREYLNRNDLEYIIPDFIRMAQKRVERDYNWKCMEGIIHGATPNDYIALPNKYKETAWLKVKDGNRYYNLSKTSYEHILNIFPDLNNRGRPRVFATLWPNGKLYLRPVPDKTYNYDFCYYAYTPELVNDTDTNWWTNNAWEVLLYGALLEAETFLIEDQRLVLWANLYKEKIEALKKVELSEEFTGRQSIRNGAVVV